MVDSLASTRLTNDRSILTWQMGKRCRWLKDEKPVPKSSSARPTPIRCSASTERVTDSDCCMTAVSTNSSMSRAGSIPVSCSAAAMSAASESSASC
jgi:hypothetical protein